jgi:TPP-dependent 2-oxoacid decarboxylase
MLLERTILQNVFNFTKAKILFYITTKEKLNLKKHKSFKNKKKINTVEIVVKQ